MYYDRAGNRIDDVMTWAVGFEGEDKRVAETTVGEYWVSTVFIGLDFGIGEGPPLIFETMIFQAEGEGSAYSFQARYSTEGEAEAGHALVVAQVEAGTLP